MLVRGIMRESCGVEDSPREGGGKTGKDWFFVTSGSEKGV